MSNDTFRFTCPTCLATSELGRADEDQIMPCPSCGTSVAVTDDAKIPSAPTRPPQASTAGNGETPLKPHEVAYLTQKKNRERYAQAEGFKRVAFRVFRLQTLETWEPLLERAAQFASSLPPESLINISHSAGRGMGSDAVAVWYWEIIPIDEARIQSATQGNS